MIAPPVAPEPPIPPSPRTYSGWVAFALLILLSIVSNVLPEPAKKTRLKPHDEQTAMLKRALAADSYDALLSRYGIHTGAKLHAEFSKDLETSVAELTTQGANDAMATMLYAEIRTFQGRSIPDAKLKTLADSVFPEDKAFYQIYSAKSLSPADAHNLIAKLPAKPFVYVAARAQALEKAGDKTAIAHYISPVPIIGAAILSISVFPFFGASLAVWQVLRRKVITGTLAPKGIPLDNITPFDADRLAIRAAQIFAVFILAGIVAVLAFLVVGLHPDVGVLSAVGGVLTIGGIYALQRAPVMGLSITLKEIGLSTENLREHIGLGVLGFLAEFPVALMLGELCAVLLRALPKATHPAATALEQSHDLMTVIPIVISGCIVAPFWEEIAFRGLLFPGLKRLTGGLVPAILASSFLFACVHPQGITVWLPLAFVGAASCFLSYQSRSLIPGIVMHCLHNGVLFVAILLS